jgi:predicted PurR-regulated permease PerM
MQENNEAAGGRMAKEMMDVFLRLGLVVLLGILCVQVFEPFLGLMLWALVLAVALYPLHRWIAGKLKGRQGLAATAIVLAGLLLLGVPSAKLAESFAGHVEGVHAAVKQGELAIDHPAESVAQWPLVGKSLYETWQLAATDMPALLEKLKPQLEGGLKWLLGLAASTVGGLFNFLGSLIIAGIMMAWGEEGSRALQRIAVRIAGLDRGVSMHRLATATIRSVATGVIGVAIIQALLLGIGFIWAGVPGAGVLALVLVFVGIAQLPALIISLPVIGYLWWAGDASTTMNVVYTVYLLVAGAVDGVLKPLLLGRGVDAPMPVVLIGALGGMVSGGMIGLFLGAVLLAVGYELFMHWVAEGSADASAAEEPAAPASADS